MIWKSGLQRMFFTDSTFTFHWIRVIWSNQESGYRNAILRLNLREMKLILDRLFFLSYHYIHYLKLFFLHEYHANFAYADMEDRKDCIENCNHHGRFNLTNSLLASTLFRMHKIALTVWNFRKFCHSFLDLRNDTKKFAKQKWTI